MPISAATRKRMLEKLVLLYSDQAESVMGRIDRLAENYADLRSANPRPLWDERSIMLITYGDQVTSPDRSALEAQRQFLLEYQLEDLISSIHLLPFFPYSSDDGFSVIDYQSVNPAIGDWSDVDRLSRHFRLAFDFVVNHCSQHNAWFQHFLAGQPPYTEYFIDADPETDLTAVTRPRSTPLLTPFQTAGGTKHVWTTFSADQVDLNFANPDVLIEALSILLSYLRHGATVIRLDAIGFLWKRPGTTCMHLPETHAVVKLMRDLIDELAPGTILLTETNVPHAENVSYFGDGDEAHQVYQFSLAPLLLDAFLQGDAQPLNQWLADLQFPGTGMTYFNFTASHDGIGVRPLEGLVSPERLAQLVAGVRDRGGLVSMRRQPDGSESPYELNITYVSAMNAAESCEPAEHARRFLASQAVMLALRGVPGVYFHSLVGTQNDQAGVERSGHNRSINRRKFDAAELSGLLEHPESLQRRIFDGYRHLLATRIAQQAFHPDADQTWVDAGDSRLVAFIRTSVDRSQQILVITNVSRVPLEVQPARFGEFGTSSDLISGKRVQSGRLRIEPYESLWLA